MPRNKKARGEEDFRHYEGNKHVFHRPGVYIGSDIQENVEEILAEISGKKIVYKKETVPYCLGLHRLLLEALQNIGDNHMGSLESGIDDPYFQVFVDHGTVTFWNTGQGIQVVKKKISTTNEFTKETENIKVWIPSLIFGHRNSGSNFDTTEDRQKSGVNGLGIKLANILSYFFKICICDPVNRKKFSQIWTRNMDNESEPEIEEYEGEISSIEISFRPHLGKLGFANLLPKVHPECLEKMARLMETTKEDVCALLGVVEKKNGSDNFNALQTLAFQAGLLSKKPKEIDRSLEAPIPSSLVSILLRDLNDTSFMCQIAFKFATAFENNKLPKPISFSPPTASDFIKNYFPTSTGFLRFQIWPSFLNGKEIEMENGKPMNAGIFPMFDLFLVNTPEASGKVYSFLNGLQTRDHGIHVDAVYEKIKDIFLPKLNESEAKKHPGSTGRLTLRDLKKHLDFLLISRLVNPDYDSNSKRKVLKYKDPKTQKIQTSLSLDLSKEEEKKIVDTLNRWPLKNALLEHLEDAAKKNLKKTDGKKIPRIQTTEGKDANKAGGKESTKCTLFLTEGKSAVQFIHLLISCYPKNWDFNGALPLRGKPINAMKAHPLDIGNNVEITMIKKWLGLQEGIDYTLPKNFTKLRYGKVVIAADADVDGYHIVCLLIVFFYMYFPSLLERGDFLYYLKTPLYKIKWKGKNLRFYTKHDFREWKSLNPTFVSTPKNTFYNKGLSGFGPEVAKEEYELRKILQLAFDKKKAENLIRMAFGKGFEDDRKKWLLDFWNEDQLEIFSEEKQKISNLLNTGLMTYSRANIVRGVPNLFYGKKSHIQILWGMVKIAGVFDPRVVHPAEQIEKSEFIKVEQAANLISSLVEYDHGAKSLMDALIEMGKMYVGSNNLRLFETVGTFGSRTTPPGAPRYIFLKLSRVFVYLFSALDIDLLVFDGDSKEKKYPRFLLPCVPLNLINGQEGMGTGWSAFFPHFNIRVLIEYIRCLIHGRKTPKLMPYFRGWTGICLPKKKNTVSEDFYFSDEEAIHESVNVEENDDEATCWLLKGKFSVFSDHVQIHEIPPYRSYEKYLQWIVKKIEDGVFTRYEDNTILPQNDKKGEKNISYDEKIDIRIYGVPENLQTTEGLFLEQTIGTGNMVALDLEHKPYNYKTLSEYLETFYQFRISFYKKRKRLILSKIQKLIDEEDLKLRLLQAFFEGKIRPFNIVNNLPVKRKKNLIEKDILNSGFTEEEGKIFFEFKIEKFSEDEVDILLRKIEKLKKEYEDLRNKTPGDLWLNDLQSLEDNCSEMF